MSLKIDFVLNGQPIEVDADPTRRLIDVLRNDLGFTGIKEACGEGECGACSILLDDRLAPACIIAVGAVAGRRVVTIEGLVDSPGFQILADAFSEAGAVQCGYCTPGMIMAAEALLREHPRPDEETIRRYISGNLCRCTGYNLIVRGIALAVDRGGDIWG
jgi:carbon-monoxide dehydrogenase small subunit